jgi:myosin heavy subunit
MLQTLACNYSKSNNLDIKNARKTILDAIYKPTTLVYSTLLECSYSKDFATCVNGKFQIPKDLNLLKINTFMKSADRYKEQIKNLENIIKDKEIAPADIAVASNTLLQELNHALTTNDLENLVKKYPNYGDLASIWEYQRQVNDHVQNLTESNDNLQKQINTLTNKLSEAQMSVNDLNGRLSNANLLQHDQTIIDTLTKQRDLEIQNKKELQNKIENLQKEYDRLVSDNTENVTKLNEKLRESEIQYQSTLDKSDKNLIQATRDLDSLRKLNSNTNLFKTQFLKFLNKLAKNLGEKIVQQVEEYFSETSNYEEVKRGEEIIFNEIERLKSSLDSNRALQIEIQKLKERINRQDQARVIREGQSDSLINQHDIASGVKSENETLKVKLNQMEKTIIEYRRIQSLAELKDMRETQTFLNNETKTLQSVKTIIENLKSLNENRSEMIDRITKLNIIFHASFLACRKLYKLALESSEPVKSQILDILKPLEKLYISNGFDEKLRLTNFHKINQQQLFSPNLSELVLEYTREDDTMEESESESETESEKSDVESVVGSDIFSFENVQEPNALTETEGESEIESTPRPKIIQPSSLATPNFLDILTDEIRDIDDKSKYKTY